VAVGDADHDLHARIADVPHHLRTGIGDHAVAAQHAEVDVGVAQGELALVPALDGELERAGGVGRGGAEPLGDAALAIPGLDAQVGERAERGDGDDLTADREGHGVFLRAQRFKLAAQVERLVTLV
jgi:hypothetical protein